MGRIAEVKRVEKTDTGWTLECDLGGADAVTVDHYQPPGEDTPPFVGDFVFLVESDGAGNYQVSGYDDALDANATAATGEKRIYSRSADGVVISEMHLRADGSGEWKNNFGTMAIAADGVVTINGVVIDTSGNISTPGDVTVKDASTPVTLSTHLHLTGVGPSQPPTPGT